MVFRPNNLNGTAKAPHADLSRLNVRSLIPRTYDEHPCHFYMGSLPRVLNTQFINFSAHGVGELPYGS